MEDIVIADLKKKILLGTLVILKNELEHRVISFDEFKFKLEALATNTYLFPGWNYYDSQYEIMNL